MGNMWRKLDNTAKAFSMEGKNSNNTFRLSAILKEKIDPKLLKASLLKTLDTYPSYKVRIKTGFFWNYLEVNSKDPIVEEEKEISCKSINFAKNDEYLFKVTYFNNRINLDVVHVLTDGLGAITLLKGVLYNYLNLKYSLEDNNDNTLKDIEFKEDEYLKNVDRKLLHKEKKKNAFLIKDESNYLNNKTYHYNLNLKTFKNVCKNHNVSISEYLTALYIYAIYKTIYKKASNKDIIINVPIDLRKHYNVESFSNFFTCMNVEGNILNKKNISFKRILNQVHKEYVNKTTSENIKKYVARDVKLGTNIGIKIVPLFMKKTFMRCLGNLFSKSSTTTLSNIGSIKVEERYKKYVDNILALVNAGKIQRAKCTICSYENNLTVTINSNLIDNKLESEFYRLLKKYGGKVRLESNNTL